jgi:hypothetical protein
VTEFVLTSVDDTRRMLHWLAKRRRTTLSGLVKGAGLRSLALVNFANLDEASQRTKDTTVGQVIQVARGNDHRVIARPAGAKHLQLQHDGAVPLEIRAAGGDLLEIPLNDVRDVRVLGRTMEAANRCSMSAIAHKAGVSLGIVSFINGTLNQGDLRLGNFIDVALAGGFELAVQPCFASRREARFAARNGA